MDAVRINYCYTIYWRWEALWRYCYCLRDWGPKTRHHRNQNISKPPLSPSLIVPSSLTQVKSRQRSLQGRVPFSRDKNWNAPLDPPALGCAVSPPMHDGRTEQPSFTRIARGQKGELLFPKQFFWPWTRVFLNQWMPSRLNFKERPFQQHSGRGWSVFELSRKKNESCCKVITNWL